MRIRAATLIGALAIPATALEASTMSVMNVAPTVDNADIASLAGEVDIGGNEGHAWGNRPRQGQSFTTGSNPGGYTFDAYTVRVQVNQGSTISANWNIRVGTFNLGTGNFSEIANEDATGVEILQSVAPDFPSYVTWTLDAPLMLLPDTVYAVDVQPADQGFISLNGTGNPYAGGTAISSGAMALPTNPYVQHTDADRAFHLNLAEINFVDMDGDGLDDNWEIANGLDPDDNGENPNNNGEVGDPDNGAMGNPDGDGLTNAEEQTRGTRADLGDTDMDGLDDHEEDGSGVFNGPGDPGSSPLAADTDGDMLDDGFEVTANPHITDPNKVDTDGDSLSDGAELDADPHVTNPLARDTDEDTIDDDVEIAVGTNPTDPFSVPTDPFMHVSDVEPTVDGADIAQLSGFDDIGGDEGHAWSNRPRQGQSFTTGSDGGGYQLRAITVRVRVDQANTVSPTWAVRVGSLDGNDVFTPVSESTINGTAIPQSTMGNQFPAFVTWHFPTPIPLDSDTSYGFDVYPEDGGFISLGEATDVLAGGSAYSCGSPMSQVFPDSPPNPVTAHGNDRHFHLDIESAGPGSGFEITEIRIVDTPEGDAFRLTWRSRPGRMYAIDASTDLSNWDNELADSLPPGGDTTTYEDLIANLPVMGPDVFFRVRDTTGQ